MMKYFLLFFIRVYWIIPKKSRNKCLFKRSCSHFVYETTNDKGLILGLKALIFRYKNCRPQHSLIEIGDKVLLVSADRQIFNENEIATHLLKSYSTPNKIYSPHSANISTH